MTDEVDEMSAASRGSHGLAFVANAARLIALVSCLATAEVRWNAANWGTHWCVAWLNVSGVTQVEVYVPPRGMAIVRLNWIK
jgi:hypothetical protein